MIGYYGQVSYSGYWPLDDEWPSPGVAVLPLFRNAGSGEKQEIKAPYYIDPAILPVTDPHDTPTEVLSGVTYTLAARTQTLFRRIIILDAGAVITGAADAILIGV